MITAWFLAGYRVNPDHSWLRRCAVDDFTEMIKQDGADCGWWEEEVFHGNVELGQAIVFVRASKATILKLDQEPDIHMLRDTESRVLNQLVKPRRKARLDMHMSRIILDGPQQVQNVTLEQLEVGIR